MEKLAPPSNISYNIKEKARGAAGDKKPVDWPL
jgi:hypothetical protein